MAITRIKHVGAELNDVAEWTNTGTQPTISSTEAQTGTYSVRYTTGADAVGVGFSSITQLRAGVFVNHNDSNDVDSSYRGLILSWTTPAGTNNYVAYNPTTNNLELVINGSTVDTADAVSLGFSTTGQWSHVGLTLFCNATTGWSSVYLDGTEVLSVSSHNTSTGVTALYFGGRATLGWNNYAYFDDFYVDNTTGEANSAPPLKRFDWSIANGNGTNSAWTGSDGNSTDNYLLVDDTTPDDDTTYVEATSTALKDTYATSNITVPSGYTITAAIPTALTKSAGGGEQLKLLAYDGANTTTSAAKSLTTDYAPVQERMTTQPDGTAWNETDFNAMEFGYESAI